MSCCIAEGACKAFTKQRVTCSALCDEATWPQAPLCNGFLHYLQRNSVLDAAPRVQHLCLCQDLQHSPEKCRRTASKASSLCKTPHVLWYKCVNLHSTFVQTLSDEKLRWYSEWFWVITG